MTRFATRGRTLALVLIRSRTEPTNQLTGPA
jgi:hypothetical protein